MKYRQMDLFVSELYICTVDYNANIYATSFILVMNCHTVSLFIFIIINHIDIEILSQNLIKLLRYIFVYVQVQANTFFVYVQETRAGEIIGQLCSILLLNCSIQ